MSEEEFRKSLNLKIDVFAAQKQHLARVTQLINKTNQFTMTTIRRTQDEVEALARRKTRSCWVWTSKTNTATTAWSASPS